MTPLQRFVYVQGKFTVRIGGRRIRLDKLRNHEVRMAITQPFPQWREVL